jgi:uncharacterized protein (DUF433 family)
MNIEIPVSHVELIDGKAYITGRMLKVRVVAGMYVHAGATVEQVMEHYSLSAAEVHAALAYYYDHQEAFEAEDRALQPVLEQLASATDTQLEQMRARRKIPRTSQSQD